MTAVYLCAIIAGLLSAIGGVYAKRTTHSNIPIPLIVLAVNIGLAVAFGFWWLDPAAALIPDPWWVAPFVGIVILLGNACFIYSLARGKPPLSSPSSARRWSWSRRVRRSSDDLFCGRPGWEECLFARGSAPCTLAPGGAAVGHRWFSRWQLRFSSQRLISACKFSERKKAWRDFCPPPPPGVRCFPCPF